MSNTGYNLLAAAGVGISTGFIWTINPAASVGLFTFYILFCAYEILHKVSKGPK